MMLENILLVIAIFSGDTFLKLEIRNYSGFASEKDGTCESYIGSPHFKKTLHIGKVKDARIRAACVASSKLAGYNDLMAQISTWREIGAPAPQAVSLIGSIRYTPGVENRKSADAYLGLGLVIVTPNGTHALYASDKVKEADLIKFDGKRVKMQAIFEDHTPLPGSIEQYPTDMEGKPLKRTGYRVMQLELLP